MRKIYMLINILHIVIFLMYHVNNSNIILLSIYYLWILLPPPDFPNYLSVIFIIIVDISSIFATVNCQSSFKHTMQRLYFQIFYSFLGIRKLILKIFQGIKNFSKRILRHGGLEAWKRIKSILTSRPALKAQSTSEAHIWKSLSCNLAPKIRSDLLLRVYFSPKNFI